MQRSTRCLNSWWDVTEVVQKRIVSKTSVSLSGFHFSQASTIILFSIRRFIRSVGLLLLHYENLALNVMHMANSLKQRNN